MFFGFRECETRRNPKASWGQICPPRHLVKRKERQDTDMAGSSIGTIFKVTTWGESHGTGLGVVIDGCPAGLALCGDDIQRFLNRRKP